MLKKAGEKLQEEEEKEEEEGKHEKALKKIEERKKAGRKDRGTREKELPKKSVKEEKTPSKEEVTSKEREESLSKTPAQEKRKEQPPQREKRSSKGMEGKPAGELFQGRGREPGRKGGGFVEISRKGEREVKKPQMWEWPEVTRKIRTKKEIEPTKSMKKIRGEPEKLLSLPSKVTGKISSEWEPPNLEDIDKRYALIDPWAYARIKWDENEGRVLYHVLEPPLTEEEEEKLEEINETLVDVLDVNLMKITERKKVKEYLDEKLQEVVRDYDIAVTKAQYDKILYYIYRNFLGLEKIEPLMHDPNIEDISCDGVDIPIYIYHRRLGSLKTNVKYKNGDKLDKFITKLAQRTGKHISVSDPLLQGALPDGSRLQATYAAGKEIAMKGSTFTIRKFMEDPITIVDQMNFGTIPALMGAYIWLAAEEKNSILVSGGTATGKTAALNTLSMFIPRDKKILSVEDTPEIQLPHEHWISKIATVTGRQKEREEGEVSMFDLIKAGLRERPDEIIVGEVRGREAYNLFQGMSTGHPGLATMHAESVEAVINRLKTPPIDLSPGLLQHLDLICILGFSKVEGMDVRRMKKVVEVVDIDMESGQPITNELFNYIPSNDQFEFASQESYILNQVKKEKGITSEKMWEELQRRAAVLKWMQEKDITNFKEIGKVISSYQSDPSKVMEKVKKEKVEE